MASLPDARQRKGLRAPVMTYWITFCSSEVFGPRLPLVLLFVRGRGCERARRVPSTVCIGAKAE